MPPKKIEEFDVYEFHVVIAEDKGSYIAIGRDENKNEVATASNTELEQVRTEIRHILSMKSNDFVGYEGAINLFLRAYPKGFRDPFFMYDEREYKQRAHDKAERLLAKNVLEQRLNDKDFVAVGESARSVFINLIFPNEAMAFGDFVRQQKNAESFAHALFGLLHGTDFDKAFDDLSSMLAPARAAKWTILTYWPFILFPDKHMFLKPEVAQESAWRLGDDFGYESRPSSAVYRQYLDYVSRLRAGITELKPRDNIDVQTFMYAVGKSGFVREAIKSREAWESSG